MIFDQFCAFLMDLCEFSLVWLLFDEIMLVLICFGQFGTNLCVLGCFVRILTVIDHFGTIQLILPIKKKTQTAVVSYQLDNVIAPVALELS
jgi:hypothetical protein